MSPEIEAALVEVADPATTSEQLLALIASPVGTSVVVQWAVHHRDVRTDNPAVTAEAWARLAPDTDLEDLCVAAGPIMRRGGSRSGGVEAVDTLAWGRNGLDAGWDDGVRAALDRCRTQR